MSIALGLPAGSTLGDVAIWVRDIARLHKGSPLSIDIRMTARGAATALTGTH